MTPPDKTPDFTESAALFAAGAQSPEEWREVLAQAASDPRLAEELRSYDKLIGEFLDAVFPVTAPDRVWAGLEQRVRGRAPRIVARRAATARWEPTETPGLTRRILGIDRARGTCTMLMRLAPGAVLAAHHHAGVEEVLVISGDLRSGEDVYGPGDYLFAEAGSDHGDLTTKTGCECLLVSPLDR